MLRKIKRRTASPRVPSRHQDIASADMSTCLADGWLTVLGITGLQFLDIQQVLIAAGDSFHLDETLGRHGP